MDSPATAAVPAEASHAKVPEALATTKRKFYKALDSLSHPPAAARPPEPAAKRVRRSVSGASTLLRARATQRPADRAQTEAAQTAPPNFSPWSQATFLARLKTFSSVSAWHPKPEAIGEVQWAKRGWVCVDVNTVACRGGCERRVVVSLDLPKKAHRTSEHSGADDEQDEEEDGEEVGDDARTLEEALVRRYETLIVEGHAQTCLWHRAGCQDDIYRLPVVRPSVWQPELKTRYQSLGPIASSIRDVRLKVLPQDTAVTCTPERLLPDLPADVLGASEGEQPPPELSVKSLEIALQGWRGSSDSGNDLLHCDACFQRIGLWMYQPGYKPSARASEDDDDDDAEDVATIDLLEMHRDHCPWRNPDTQKASGSLSGLNACQILRRVVSTYAREQRRRRDEQLRATQPPEGANADDENEAPASPAPSREDVARQDKERESRLRKLKSLFTIKRKPALPAAKPLGKLTK